MAVQSPLKALCHGGIEYRSVVLGLLLRQLRCQSGLHPLATNHLRISGTSAAVQRQLNTTPPAGQHDTGGSGIQVMHMHMHFHMQIIPSQYLRNLHAPIASHQAIFQ
jgi:hypothetical protein